MERPSEEGGEIQGFPSIDEDGETAEVEGGVEFDGVGLKGGFAGKGGGDELADFEREFRAVADGAGAGAIGGNSSGKSPGRRWALRKARALSGSEKVDLTSLSWGW